ncbi:tRNA(Met) cytidine acetyltransferase TmcA [Halorubrum gandharaense]
MIAELAADLRAEAKRANERRLLVLAGDRDRGIDAAFDTVEGADVDEDAVSIVSTREGFRFEEHRPRRAGELLGRTRQVVVLDAHERFVPNALGQVSGAVDGGGLLVLLTPPLAAWPDRRDKFDESLAVPPYELDDVTGRFRERLVRTIRRHPGVAVVDLDDESPEVVRDGRTDPPEWRPRSPPDPPADAAFPDAAYVACLTGDQTRALRALESLADPAPDGSAVVVEADRGRGKSSAAGLAAGSLVLDGRDVLVTAPAFRNAAEGFDRARELLEAADALETEADDGTRLEAPGGGRMRFRTPAEAAELPGEPDAVIVDEAAAIPVRLLEEFLDADAVAFCTTVHGYEGAGRGFSVRFRERLSESDHQLRDVSLTDPIRYARGDPVEGWTFRALLLDARPPVDAAVEGTTPDDCEYRRLDPDELLADEHLLSETFGLLVSAHYRTEPNDLARLLDAPNLSVRALVADGHVVAVDLLAREGNLPADTRAAVYEGARLRGNMVPDVLTSQLRDEKAAAPLGLRTVRIATHHAVRDQGLGSRLLTRVHEEHRKEVDYFSVGFGATPRLLRFWRRAGYRTAHLASTRNDASGEYSAVLLRPPADAAPDDAGAALLDRHAAAFRERERAGLTDTHRGADPDVIRGALRACPAGDPPALSDYGWRAVVGAAYGPTLYDAAPGAFRDLAFHALVGGEDGGEGHADASESPLSPREERLLVTRVLQARDTATVADLLDFHGTRGVMRALGEAFVPLVDAHDDVPVVRREIERFR